MVETSAVAWTASNRTLVLLLVCIVFYLFDIKYQTLEMYTLIRIAVAVAGADPADPHSMAGYELVRLDGGGRIHLPEGETVLGRGPFLGVSSLID